MISKILIANRGEVAVRIARAAAALGIKTVSIFSEDDAASLHVLRSDERQALSGAGPQAYLDQDAIIRAALDSGADAVHPGYGFLSESAAFAERLAAAGLCFIGPDPAVLTLFGDKGAARDHAMACGVPVPRGTQGPTTVAEARRLFADGVDVLMVKAVSGGGGRGMRIVRQVDALDQAFDEASAEARVAFGCGDLYVEEFVPEARHLEVQIIGDGETVLALGERECTLQRRHQKLIEVAPSPSLSPPARAGLIEAALRLSRVVCYRGLGTFEFLVREHEDGSLSHVFIECNPRLQVEHTVTEELYGIDLVGAQIEVASGKSLSALSVEVDWQRPAGYALQLRVNTEKLNARGEVSPADGEITSFELPGGPGVRVDSFAYVGFRPNLRFDTLVAKLILRTSSGDYAEVLRKAAFALDELKIDGVETNCRLLANLLRSPRVIANAISTEFVDRMLPDLLASIPQSPRHFARDVAGSSTKPDDLAPIPEGLAPILAPLSGLVVEMRVAEGDWVDRGAIIAVVEAMKMQNPIEAGVAGIVRGLRAVVGRSVREGDALLYIEEAQDEGLWPDVEQAQTDEAMSPLLGELLRAREMITDDARHDRLQRIRDRGQATCRENIAQLCDADSFVEFGSLLLPMSADPGLGLAIAPGDGVICGYATINRELFGADAARCMVVAFDQSSFAGTLGHAAKQKIERAFRIAGASRLPIVIFADGGGARSGESEARFGESLETFAALAALNGLCPTVAIVAGRCFAGNAAFAGLCDIIIGTQDASVGMAGPAMIEAGGLGKVLPDDVGPAKDMARAGVIDVLVDDMSQAIGAACRYLGYFQGDVAAFTCADQNKLRSAIPTNRLQAYDGHALIHCLADSGSVTELRPNFGRAMISIVARIDGMPVGILANNPRHLGGAIDAAAADKAARFMHLCDTYGIPLLTLCDTPGFMVGPDAEREALIRRVSRMMIAGAKLSIPHLTVVLRKCYGLGGLAMNGGSVRGLLHIASWPTGEFGPMNPEGSVTISHRRELAVLDDADARRSFIRARADEIYNQGKALNIAHNGGVDEIIDPAETRRWVVTGLRARRRHAEPSLARRFFDAW